MSHAILLTLLLLAVGSNANAQAQLPTDEDGTTELTVSVKNPTVKVGESLTLYITMRNMRTDNYCHTLILETGRADLNGYKVEVVDSGGTNYPMLKQKRLRAWSYSEECLKPGKATSEQMNIDRLVDLSKPGIYHIRVSHLDAMTNTIVWSNSLAVTITQ